MKLMFHKTELTGKWFKDGEVDTNYTDKVPQHTLQVWDEEQGEWVESEVVED